MAVNCGANPRQLAMATPPASPASFAALAGTVSFSPLSSVYWRTSDSKCVNNLPQNGWAVNLPHFPLILTVIEVVRFLPQLALQDTDAKVHRHTE